MPTTSRHLLQIEGMQPPAIAMMLDLAESYVLLNRSGTTFRSLPDADKQGIDEGRAIALMVAQPSMIKRPVLDVDGVLLVGFKPEQYAAAFA